MRCVVEPARSPAWCRLTVFAAIGAVVAGCSAESQRFDANPFASGSPHASGEVTGSIPQQPANVQSKPLPPPSTAGMQAPATRPVTSGVSGGARGMGSYRPEPRGDVTGSVPPTPPPPAPAKPSWHWEGGTPVTVAPGDTADTLARRYGVPAQAIVQANNLPNAAAIRPGQRLVIPRFDTAVTGSAGAPRGTSHASRQPAPRVDAPATTGDHVHVVAPGETLMQLSRQYQRSLSEIANANNIPPYTLLKVGDRIAIPGVAAARNAPPRTQPPLAQRPKPAAPPSPAPPKVAAAPAVATTSARLLAPAQDPVPETTKAEPKPQTVSAVPSFRWPVRGRVIAGFGPKPTGKQNDGINVAVPEGTPVHAAEDGIVAYAGNELKSYGNLVLVRHANGYVTAYAHAREILVRRDEPVKRGQVIARAGQTGSVQSPQLHFEIRRGSTPVDPMPFLDKGGGA